MNRLMWVIIVVMLLFFLVFISVRTIGEVMPYEPLVVDTYKFGEAEACPGNLIDLVTERYVNEEYDVDNIHVESYWLKVDDSRPYLPYSYDLDKDELADTEGAALRLTPFSRGDWMIKTEFTIEGTVLGFVPRTQELELITSNTLEVPADVSNCNLGTTQDNS